MDSISGLFIKKMYIKKTFNTQKEINNKIIDIRKTANRNGYLFATIKKKIINDSTSQISFKLNRQFENIKILFNENTIKRIEIEKIIKKKINNNYFLIKTKNIEKLLYELIENKNNTGEIFTNIQLKNIHLEGNELIADLLVNNKQTRIINEIIVKGYERFPKKFLKHHLRIKENDILNLESIEQKSLRINSLSFASEIKKPEILFKKDSSAVFLSIKKENSNDFEGFLGFATNKENEKIELNGNIKLNLINNLNKGEELKIKYQSTENQQKQTNIKIKIPYIFSTALSLSSELDLFKKDSSFTNSSQTVNTSYNINNKLSIGIAYKTKKSNTLIDTLNQKDFKTKTFALKLNHEIRSLNEIFKYKTRTSITTSIGNRNTEQEKNNQQEVEIISSYNFKLNKNNSIFIKANNYYLFNKNTLENELLYIGGINSIRGIKENSIPSKQYTIINTEYRILLNKNLYTHTVFDYALTKDNETNEFNKIIGFGLGFGLRTNKNILRFIIANNKIEEQKIKINETKIHLSLLARF
jgi:hypothetical protein